MSINASRFYGIGLALLGGAVFAACANSTDAGITPGGSAGAGVAQGGASGAGTAGAFVATAGDGVAGSFVPTAGDSFGGTTFGTAGANSAGSPATAGGGSGGGSSAACAGLAPSSALITSFDDLVTNPSSAGDYTFLLGLPGGTFSYVKPALTLSSAGMALGVSGMVSNYDGFGVYFGTCTNASAYTGVSFKIAGSVGPSGMLSFRFQTNADTAIDPVNKKGSCVVPVGTADSYPLCHSATFSIPVTTTGATVSVKFSDVTMGFPVPTVDGKDLVGLEWAFTWAGTGSVAYPANVTLDNLMFTGGPAGTGGAGGAGGSSAGAGGGGASSGGSGG